MTWCPGCLKYHYGFTIVKRGLCCSKCGHIFN